MMTPAYVFSFYTMTPLSLLYATASSKTASQCGLFILPLNVFVLVVSSWKETPQDVRVLPYEENAFEPAKYPFWYLLHTDSRMYAGSTVVCPPCYVFDSVTRTKPVQAHVAGIVENKTHMNTA